jgi:competence protein ComEC
VSVLLTGDIEAEVEHQWVVQGATLASMVLKAPRHGSRSSTTLEFLEAVDPEVVGISDPVAGHRLAVCLRSSELSQH